MGADKTSLLQTLDAERDNLWALLADVDSQAEIYPGWNTRDFFAHMAGWDSMVFEVFRDTVAGVPVKDYAYTTVDETNAHFVAERQSMTLISARRECEVSRFALKTVLESTPADDYSRFIQLPWGSETVIQFVEGAIKHEHDHAQDIAELKQAGRL